MSEKKSNCCATETSNCNTQETSCCSTEKKSITGTKKKIGLGILLLALIFALVSAFSKDSSSKIENCSTNETGCATSCETVDLESNCCSEN